MNTFFRMTVLAAALSLAACAGKTTREEPVEGEPVSGETKTTEAAGARAVKRWELLIAGKPGEAYDLLSPGYRATRTRDEYVSRMNSKPLQYLAVELVDENCDQPEVCTVKLNVSYSMQMPVPGVGKVESVNSEIEKWIKADGEWFLIPVTDPSKGLR